MYEKFEFKMSYILPITMLPIVYPESAISTICTEDLIWLALQPLTPPPHQTNKMSTFNNQKLYKIQGRIQDLSEGGGKNF